MSENFDENNGLLDEDPALDFILYQEMERESKGSRSKSGCLAGVLLLILPLGNFIYYLTTL